MKKYTLSDGSHILAPTPADFVDILRAGSKFDSECSNEQYMQNYAERFLIQSGETIRFENPEQFVEDLINAGEVSVD